MSKYPYKNLPVNDFYMQKAEDTYNHYGAAVDFKNFQGNPMPLFTDLPPAIKKAWHDATRYAYNDGASAQAHKHPGCDSCGG